MVDELKKKNPLQKIFDFRRQEIPMVVLMFFFFFLIIAVFQLLRPLKKGLFVDSLGADIELYAKLLNIVLSAVGVWLYTFMVNHLARQRVIYALCIFFAASFAFLAQALQTPAQWTIWTFYLLGDFLSTIMVTAFWAYLTDISSPDQAGRLYGVIGAGGVLGGWCGVSLAKLLLKGIHMEGLLMLAAGLMVVVLGLVYLLNYFAHRSTTLEKDTRPVEVIKEANPNAAMEGARLVLRSRYLAAIAGLMAFYEIGSQVNDYQFSKFAEGLEGIVNTQAFMTNVAFYANALAVVVQLFVVSLLIRRLGVKAALLVLPVAMLFSSFTFMLFPGLLFASLLFISDNGLNYSVQQTSRESLYVVTSPDEKYKARAFTNMFVQRSAKGLAIFLVLGLGLLGLTGTSVRYLSIITMVTMAIMILLSIYAGRQFVQHKREEAEAPPNRKASFQPA